MRAPRILFVSVEVPGFGGSSTAGYSLFARMQRGGHDVHFLNLVEPSAAGRHARTFGPDAGNPERLGNVSTCLLRDQLYAAHPELADAIDVIAPDVTLGLGYIAAVVAGRTAPGRRLTYLTGSSRQAREYLQIGWARDMIALAAKLARRGTPPRILNATEAEAVDRSLVVLTHSAQTQAMMQWFFPSHIQKIHPRVFSMAEWISEGAEPFRARARPFEARDIDLLFVAADWGRHEKNYGWVEAITRRVPTARVHVVGQAPWSVRGATHHGFLPGREELFALMGRTRCVVSPSVSDAAPGVLFEASVMGCNVVASRNCGNWELCHPALLADSFTIDAFATCAARAMEQKYEDSLARLLAARCYGDLVDTLLALGRPFEPRPPA